MLKTVLIIGASGSIGNSLLRAFIDETKYNLVLTYNTSKIDLPKKKNSNSLRNIDLFKLNVVNEDSFLHLKSILIKKEIKLDVIIYLAGTNKDDLIRNMDTTNWDHVHNVNSRGAMLVIKHLSLLMPKHKNSKLIFVSSQYSHNSRIHQANYCSSKASLNMLCKVASLELGCYGISVNLINPGFIQSALNRKQSHKFVEANDRSILKKNTQQRDLNNFLLFFISDKIEGVTGQSFNIDDRNF
ncbi:SDR family oxidoreductase [Enterococcus ureasiticus]|uniref:SDR family oxidoreductase n=1 Tax=Enterococcus ureasiticus TaxID=903984 RepID=A0A1E5GCF2_9ENTE|nr:SDR family oxidoreductase [Enterococcus ureasiticus]OEG10347.1 hypothetical protein BCR21_13440 [Enterococcus ureasiticus]